MSEQWKRACQLIVGLEHGKTDALDFSDLRITFRVGQAMTGLPSVAEIYIYNLSAETMNKFKGKDNNFVIGQNFALYAGYQNNMGLIFQGQVFQFRRGRESPTDTYLCIIAQNADTAHNFAIVQGNLAKGWNLAQEKEKIMDSMRANGMEKGYQADPAHDKEAPRGKTYFDLSSEYLQQYAETNNQDFAYANNQVVIVERDRPADAKALVLNTQTGLIGMPQLTMDGLRADCLLNPKIKIGDQVVIDERSVQTQNFDVEYGSQEIDQDFKQAFGADGHYNVISVMHEGDTRGDTWYTSIVALGVGATQAKSGVAISGVQNSV